MFDHVTIRVSDLEASRSFYATVFDRQPEGEEFLEWAMDQGTCGAAWADGLFHAAPDEKPIEAWNMNEDQRQACEEIGMVLSLPLVDPGQPDQPRAVFNIDDTEPPGEHFAAIRRTMDVFAPRISQCLVTTSFAFPRRETVSG